MSYAFIRDNKVYLLSNGVLTEINERLKVKDSVVGYVVSEEGGKIRFTKVPIHDCSRLSYFSGVLRDYLKGSVAVFESSESACILFNPPSLKTGLTYDLVAGRVFLRGDKRSVMEAMDQYDVVKFALERYGDEEVKRRAVISLVRLDKCDEAISLYTSLKEKDPEESLAVAECYEKTGKELEALKIYSFFSEEKYRELESKLIAKADALVVEFEKQGNPKLLMEALNVLPTYDIPAVKLGLHYLNKNKVEEAVNMFEEALRRNRNFQNLVLLGSALLRKDPKRALEVLDEAQKIRRTAPLAYLRGKAFEALNSPPHAMREYLYACREGVVEACSKAIPATRQEFDPDQWIGYVLYGYEIRSVLGRGGMGYVLLAEKNGKQFAMKVMKKEYRMDEFLYEVAKMQEISKGSRNMVRILANFIDENWTDYYGSPPAIVMEYMAGGDLRRILADEEYSSLRHSVRWGEVVSLIYSQIAEAVIHLHKQGYVHADIKPSNILFDRALSKYGEEAEQQLLKGDVIPRLSDFGSSIRIGSPVIHYTPYYAHPKQRFGGKAETSMDVYSFVVSLYVTLTNNFPYPEWLERELEEAIISPEKRADALKDFYSVEPRMDYVPQEFREIIQSGLRGDATMEQIRRELLYVAKYDYNLPVEVSV
ncbi:protein kinase domain-containing protein [Metallosphaera sedula]|uniref:protein kinase domain-containing protein n=1 Tax=Metallosphaera sedula TaxID=43687 RepID=UPI0020C172C0|nr:protein kinase [Metallosphaera sedula]BBL46853.1 serine/threonine-protein kinase ArnS [Metallosphaera sedula]